MRFRLFTVAALVALVACVAAKHEEKPNVVLQADGGALGPAIPRMKPGIVWPLALASVRGRGLALFRCDITIEGATENCTLKQGVDGVDAAALLSFASTLKFEPGRGEHGASVSYPSYEFRLDIRRARNTTDGGAYYGIGADDDPTWLTPDMKKPKLDIARSEPFHWKASQLDAHIAGLVLIQCDVTTSGRLQYCVVLKRIPQVPIEQILGYANGLVYSPAAFTDGGAAAVSGFTIPLRLKVP